MFSFTKEAVHEVVAARVSQIETCEHQRYLLQELQIDPKMFEALNHAKVFAPIMRNVLGILLVVDRKTNAVLGLEEKAFDLQFSHLGGQARVNVTGIDMVCKCCSLKHWSSYAEVIAKNGPQDERAKLAAIILTLVREREDWLELVEAADKVVNGYDDEDYDDEEEDLAEAESVVQ